VISVLDLNPVKVRVAIPEAEIGKVREGARATVAIPSLDGRKFEGTVEVVGVASDPASRTYTAKIAVQNPQRLLRAGMVSEARIYSSSMVNAITVPATRLSAIRKASRTCTCMSQGSSGVRATGRCGRVNQQ